MAECGVITWCWCCGVAWCGCVVVGLTDGFYAQSVHTYGPPGNLSLGAWIVWTRGDIRSRCCMYTWVVVVEWKHNHYHIMYSLSSINLPLILHLTEPEAHQRKKCALLKIPSQLTNDIQVWSGQGKKGL